MTKAERCLFEATDGWKEHEVVENTGLPKFEENSHLIEFTDKDFWEEVIRVRDLYKQGER